MLENNYTCYLQWTEIGITAELLLPVCESSTLLEISSAKAGNSAMMGCRT